MKWFIRYVPRIAHWLDINVNSDCFVRASIDDITTLSGKGVPLVIYFTPRKSELYSIHCWWGLKCVDFKTLKKGNPGMTINCI